MAKSKVWKIPIVSRVEAYVRFPNPVTEDEALAAFKKDMITGVEKLSEAETVVGFHAERIEE